MTTIQFIESDPIVLNFTEHGKVVKIVEYKQEVQEIEVGSPTVVNIEGDPTLEGRVEDLENALLISENSVSLNAIASTPLTFTSALAQIETVRAYLGTRDITSSLTIDLNGSNVTIESNSNISNIILKLIGK